MASSNRIITLGLGSQVVRLAEFSADKRGGLTLVNYQTSELLADPAADATRTSQISMTLREIVQSYKLSGLSVNYAIPSQTVFTRFVKLPSVDEEKVEQIVEFEAQQNVPFPIADVVWDYQLITSTEPGKFEVVLVAIKSDLLDEINDAVQGSGLRTRTVDVSPTATYNAFRYNYGDVPGCSVVIDVGARSTNLVFIEPNKVFSRAIPIGGNSITAAIAKDFAEPFGASEERKKLGGIVSLGGNYADPRDPEVARMSKIVRNTMTRLHAEISRSISFYRSQQGGSHPERVYLAGGSVVMPYMLEFFKEKLALPIEFFNPLRNVAVASTVDSDLVSREAQAMGELIGLALRNVSDCPLELSLCPASVESALALDAKKPFLALAAVCLLAGLGTWWFYLSQAAAVQAAVLEKLTPKVATLSTFESKFTKVKKQIEQTQSLAAPLANLVEERSQWVALIEDLNARLPELNIWITSLEVTSVTSQTTPTAGASAAPGNPNAPAAKTPKTPQQILIVKGLYLDNPRGPGVIDDYAKALAESPFLTVDLNKKQEINPVRSTDINQWTLAYELRLPLAKPLPL